MPRKAGLKKRQAQEHLPLPISSVFRASLQRSGFLLLLSHA